MTATTIPRDIQEIWGEPPLLANEDRAAYDKLAQKVSEDLSPTCIAPVIARRRIGIAGHRGMVGSALMRRLAREDCEIRPFRRGCTRPDVVVLAAARVAF
jgi:hypothetical protein